MPAPAISVLCAFHNEAHIIGTTLESLNRQTFSDFEVVFVDDCSRDGTADLIARSARFPFRVIQNRRKMGLSRSLNRGLKEAKGELIARLDADDIMDASRLEKQHSEFQKDRGLVLLGGQCVKIDDAGQPFGKLVYPIQDRDCRFALNFCSPIAHPAAMFRAEDARAVKGYDEKSDPAEDFRLWTKLSNRGTVRNLPDTLLQYRIRRTQSITSSRRQEQLRKHAFIIRDCFLPTVPSLAGMPLHLRRFARIMTLIPPQDRAFLLRKMARVISEGRKARL